MKFFPQLQLLLASILLQSSDSSIFSKLIEAPILDTGDGRGTKQSRISSVLEPTI